MSTDYKFPTDVCVLACSGPSLNLVDPFELGVPVVAVSTAIRVITNPHYWVLADFLNEMHGEEGSVAYQNENVVKVVPMGKTHIRHKTNIRNAVNVPYQDAAPNSPSKEAHLFSGKYPLLKGPHKSVTLAIQWLHQVGVKKVIWVGNNLRAISPEEKYAYKSTSTDLRKAHNYSATLDQSHRALKEWYPIAKKKGFEWYSWKCGEVFEKFVPPFDYDAFVKSESVFSFPAEQSKHEVVSIAITKPQKHRATKQEKREVRNFRQVEKLRRPNKEERRQANQERLQKQREEKQLEINLKKNQPKIINAPKTPVSNKKYPKYVKANPKSIKDSLR